ncbi:MAG: bifunctional diaminohydroxyphosphoribosylaminopyrimidine deaminase/5-amino-6-(5-phosphoribosylamino)uracil reductase RibD [Acidobacteriaceae bacterium]|nr:bifunctional diaminohydroxyphosphoribosylaminopyrimidine deaminase/5-amino-6-(5-phosphoribosylamino)uracil reductase RibD [Acidobacteriaceae bacterium]
MPWLPDDDRFLHRALELARDASAFASPNPAVGCVLTTATGDVLGEGAHLYDLRDHAEIVALKDVAVRGHSPYGATAYVTLEPCSIHGRTGPCADALLAAGISRCVVATADPNPSVHGRGLAKLRSAGIAVEVVPASSEIAQQARRLNDAFAFSIVQGRPFVTLKAALSVDGKLAPPPSQRSAEAAPHWLTGPAARADVQQLRHTQDAILTGIGTVLVDDPSLTDRTGQPRRRPLLRVVLDSHLRTPPTAALFREATILRKQKPEYGDTPNTSDLLLFGTAGADSAALTATGADVELLPELSPLAVLKALHRRNIRSVLLEAGSRLNAAFLRAGLVDKLVLYFAESELGPDALPFAVGGPSPFAIQERLSNATRATFPHGDSEDIRITGYLHDPWAAV